MNVSHQKVKIALKMGLTKVSTWFRHLLMEINDSFQYTSMSARSTGLARSKEANSSENFISGTCIEKRRGLFLLVPKKWKDSTSDGMSKKDEVKQRRVRSLVNL